MIDFQHYSLIISANNRSARWLKSEAVLQAKSNSVPDCHILPLNAFWKDLWQQFQASGYGGKEILLSDTNMQALWAEIIGSYPSLIDQVIEAYQSLHLYQLLDLSFANETIENQQFLKWKMVFDQRCHKEGWITSLNLPTKIVELIKEGTPFYHQTILLYGFLEMPPLLENMIELLKARGIKIMIKMPDKSSESYQISALNVEQEIALIAKEANYFLKQGKKVGVVFSDLSLIRNQVISGFKKEMDDACFDLSLGAPLISFPMIQVIFLLFDFLKLGLPFEKMSLLLRSPFIGGGVIEASKRALLEVKLREKGQRYFSLSDVLSDDFNSVPLFQALFKKIKMFDLQKTFGLSELCALFQSQIQSIGWPGDRVLSSEEVQMILALEKAFDQLKGLTLVLGDVSVEKAIDRFLAILMRTIFQPKQKETRLQILGMMEGVGLTFDVLFVAGINANLWPQALKPNPFLKIEFQRQYHFPHASQERELHYARQLMHVWSCSSETVIFTYRQQEEDEILQASPLLPHAPIYQWHAKIADPRKTLALEVLEDEYGPLLKENEKYKGGAYLFKYQALCPFRAFALCRLQVKPLERLSLGVSPITRGQLIHKSLEIFWRTCKHHERLVHMDNDALKSAIDLSIQNAKESLFSFSSDTLFTLEIERLKRVMFRWLSMEKARAPFEVVATEKWKRVSIGALNLQIQIDRIDQIANEWIIIDYKSGRTKVEDWLGERPSEPQLPLYAISMEKTPSAISFAQIRRDEMSFKSLGKEVDYLPEGEGVKRTLSIRLSWDDHWPLWQQSLYQLASEFEKGYAAVSPKNGQQTCEYCKLKSLCRYF